MNVNVISASTKDMDAIYLMGFDAWGVGFSTQQYLEACRSSPKYKLGKWFYLEENSAPVSSLIVYKNQFELQNGYAGLGSISTVPSRRGRGFASQLIADCVEKLLMDNYAGVYLHCETESSIYERLGFQNVISEGEAQLMLLELKKGIHVSRPDYF